MIEKRIRKTAKSEKERERISFFVVELFEKKQISLSAKSVFFKMGHIMQSHTSTINVFSLSSHDFSGHLNYSFHQIFNIFQFKYIQLNKREREKLSIK